MSSRSTLCRSRRRAHWPGSVVVVLVMAAGWFALGPSVHADLTFDQLGTDLAGGPDVALSESGDRVAIGSPGPWLNRNVVGIVRVYAWDGSAWSQLGADLRSEEAGDQFGRSVSLSADGNRVAVGAEQHLGDDFDGLARVFEWDGSSWNQLGDDINGDAETNRVGAIVELSSDGNRVAVAGYNHVRVVDWDGSDWIQAGSDLRDGERGMAMSADGRRIATGPNGGLGDVFVHDWNGSQWVPVGSGIDGHAEYSSWGGCVTMSADGGRIAACGDIGEGHPVSLIFDWDGSDWVQVGGEIPAFVWAMSADGHRLAMIDPVRIYDWNGSDWVETGATPSGDRLTDLSADGSIVAAGVTGDVTRVFSIAAAPPTTPTVVPETTLGPSATLPPTGPSQPSTGLFLASMAMIAAGAFALAIRRRDTRGASLRS